MSVKSGAIVNGDPTYLTEGEDIKRAVDLLRSQLEGKTDGYEIFLSSEKGLAIEVQEGLVDSYKVRSSTGVGIRTLIGGRGGFGSTTLLSDGALKSLVEETIEGSRYVEVDEALRFAKYSEAEGSVGPGEVDLTGGIYDPAIEGVSEGDKIALAKEIETTALAFDPRVKGVRKAGFSESFSTTRVINSEGIDYTKGGTFFSASASAVAEEEGESEIAWEVDLSHKRGDIDPGRIGKGAAERAVKSLGGRKIDTVRCPAVIENLTVIDLLQSLAPSLLGDNVEKGMSMLAGKVGDGVASEMLSIVDDGRLPGGWATSARDGEGVPKGRSPLITDGVLKGYLYNTYWAGRCKTNSTGNGSRGSYKGTPSVGVTNLFIEGGSGVEPCSLDRLMEMAGDGLFITDLMGVHTINTVTGDFSLGASGFRIEGGKVTYPVRGMAVAGNLLSLFKAVTGVGTDTRMVGSVGAPSLLLSEIDASGS